MHIPRDPRVNVILCFITRLPWERNKDVDGVTMVESHVFDERKTNKKKSLTRYRTFARQFYSKSRNYNKFLLAFAQVEIIGTNTKVSRSASPKHFPLKIYAECV